MTRTLRANRLHALLVALILLLPVLRAPWADAQTPPFVGRIAGSDRIGTAIELSQRAWGTPPVNAVLIARADAFPDALAAGPLARQLNAPILLTNGNELVPAVANEVRRLAPGTAYLLGGEAALSQGVETALRSLVPNVRRLAGPTRYATAEAIADLTNGNTAVVASGESFPDALSASGLAPSEILLTQRNRLSFDPRRLGPTTIVGGTAVIAPNLLVAPRLAGANRYLTNLAVLQEVFARRDGELQLFVATGENFPDALAAGSLTQPILLVNPAWTELPPELEAFLNQHKARISAVFIFGGAAAVPETTERLVAAALGVPAPGPEPTPTEEPTPGEDPTEEPTEEPAPPATATALTATAQSPTEIRLTWTDNATDETGYEVERRVGTSGSFTRIAELDANAESFTNSGLTAETQYCYRVRAVNGAGPGGYSDDDCATTPAEPEPVTAPDRLEVIATGPTRAALSWRDNSSNETSFEVERAVVEAGPFTFLKRTSANDRNTNDNGLEPSTSYCYRVRAVSGDAQSAYSPTVCITTPPTQTIPATPTDLTATATSSSTIDLEWSDNDVTELEFIIERSLGSGGPFGEIDRNRTGDDTYTDTGLEPDTEYCYQVRATNEAGDSEPSDPACATTEPAAPAPAPPSAPENLSLEVETSTVRLTWDDTSGNEEGFRIERRIGPDGGFTLLTNTDANEESHTDDDVDPGTEYCYRVRAFNDAGTSNFTDVECVETPEASTFGMNRLSLLWSASWNGLRGLFG